MEFDLNIFLKLIAAMPNFVAMIFFIFWLIRKDKKTEEQVVTERKLLDEEKNAFREYLIRTNAEHHEIIKQNTEGYKQNAVAYDNNSRIIEKLINVIEKKLN